MHPKTPAWLDDIRQSAALILEATADMTAADYQADQIVRRAVERCFEIVGEALNRLAKTDPDTAARITDVQAIIGFRNILAHGYDIVDHERVWQVIQKDVPVLLREVEQIIGGEQASKE